VALSCRLIRRNGSIWSLRLRRNCRDHLLSSLFSFPSLADYERYRTAVKNDETARAAWRYQEETRCIVSLERSFMRPVSQ
jgi:hypothetical protein